MKSIYAENGKWYKREFSFSLMKAIEPENNCIEIEEPLVKENRTEVHLMKFRQMYRDEVALALDSLAKKIIEHCLPYFIIDNCPTMEIVDSLGGKINLNDYYRKPFGEEYKILEVIKEKK